MGKTTMVRAGHEAARPGECSLRAGSNRLPLRPERETQLADRQGVVPTLGAGPGTRSGASLISVLGKSWEEPAKYRQAAREALEARQVVRRARPQVEHPKR